MRVGVLGGGVQGCCTALELADRGVSVELIERDDRVMDRASRWNEGKLHLGYVYARDRSLDTARAMVAGSQSFVRWFEERLAIPVPDDRWSDRFVYAVCCDSELGVDDVASHLADVDRAVKDLTRGAPYGFADQPSTEVSPSTDFDTDRVVAAFSTPERSIDVEFVADHLARAVADHPHVQLRLDESVTALDRTAGGDLRVSTTAHPTPEPYDHVVNATWQHRLALDHGLGIDPGRPWVHRYKLALHLRDAGVRALPSATFVHGPFGDIVTFGDGRCYLSWYPACRIGYSTDLEPPDFAATLDAASRRAISDQTVTALAELVPALNDLDLARCHATLRGGFIFARASSDIDDRSSGLHRRVDTGVSSYGNHHTIDTGKYCLAPSHARIAADRITGTS